MAAIFPWVYHSPIQKNICLHSDTMISSSKGGTLTASGFHNFFSLVIGAITVRLVHAHEVVLLVAAQVLWLLSMAFINARAKRAGGKFLEAEVSLYHGLGISLYVMGLLLAACFYTVFS